VPLERVVVLSFARTKLAGVFRCEGSPCRAVHRRITFKVDLLFPLSSSHFPLRFSSNRDPNRAPSLVLPRRQARYRTQPRAARPPPLARVRASLAAGSRSDGPDLIHPGLIQVKKSLSPLVLQESP
jgi:hypothetical protein